MKEKFCLKNVIFGALIFVVIAFVEILLFALFLKKVSISNNAIKWISQLLKIIALFVSCVFNVKDKKGLCLGGLIGLFGSLLLLIIFYIFHISSFNILSFILELVFCMIVGGIFGIFTVNVKNR